jgi:hypothetical protein
MIKRLALKLTLTLAVALALVGISAVPASAAYSNCWTGYVCIWDGNDGTGDLIFSYSAGPGVCANVPASANDRANSFYNRMYSTGRYVQFFQHAGCTGHILHNTANDDGPFSSGWLGNFEQLSQHQFCHCDRNILTSMRFSGGV